MTRILRSLAITGFFLLMMGFLFRDHIIPAWNRGGGIEVEHSVLTDSWSNQDNFNELKVDDFTLGGLRTTAEYEVDGNYYTYTAHLLVDTPVLKTRIVSWARMNHRLELETVRIRAHLPGFTGNIMDAENLDTADGELPPGVIELTGKFEGRRLFYRLRRENAVRYASLSLDRPVTMTDSMIPILGSQMLTKNVVYALDVYDPFLGNKAGKMEIELIDVGSIINIGDSEKFLRTVELRLDNLRTHLFVDEGGTIWRREIFLFSGSKTSSAPSALEGSKFIFQHLNARSGRDKFPTLDYLPQPVEISKEDVMGENSGELSSGNFDLFSLVAKGYLGK